MEPPSLTYLTTFTTYGERVHGDERGSVLRDRHGGPSNALEPDTRRERAERADLKHPPVVLDRAMRESVAATITEVCRFKNWTLAALNVRSNHVHVLVTAWETPEEVMLAFKSWSTRRLREQGLQPAGRSVWTRHGSTRYVKTEAGIRRAAEYVLEGQGEDLGGVISGFAED